MADFGAQFVERFADLVADRVVERLGATPTIQQAGFSPREAGAYLGCSERLVRKLIDDGDLASVKLGTRVVIHRQELDRLLLGSAVAS